MQKAALQFYIAVKRAKNFACVEASGDQLLTGSELGSASCAVTVLPRSITFRRSPTGFCHDLRQTRVFRKRCSGPTFPLNL